MGVIRLVTGQSVEEKIYAAAQSKLNMDSKVIQAGKFDQKSTGLERRTMLKDILEKEEEEETEEVDYHTDEQINEFISRSEEELNYFKRMDLLLDERDAHEAKNLKELRGMFDMDNSKEEIDELTGTVNSGIAKDGFEWPEWKKDMESAKKLLQSY